MGQFLQVSGQIKEWPILKLHEMKRVVNVLAYPIVFVLFDDPDLQEVVLELMKNDQFLAFLAVWVLFPKVLGRLRSGLC